MPVVPNYHREQNDQAWHDIVTIILNKLQSYVSTDAPPSAPKEFSAKTIPLGVRLTWLPVRLADYYRIYAGSTNDASAKTLLGRTVGKNNVSYTDVIGSPNVQKFYWVEAVTHTESVSDLAGCVGISGEGVVDLPSNTFRIGAANSLVGFYGAAPVARPSQYVQTYATASRTHSNPTASAVTLTSTQTTPWGFGSQAQADSIQTAINNLITDVANVKQVLNQLIDDLQHRGDLQ